MTHPIAPGLAGALVLNRPLSHAALRKLSVRYAGGLIA